VQAGAAWLAARRPDEALRRFEQAHAAAPRDLDLRRRIAELCVERGAVAQAIAELEGARALDMDEAARVALVRRLGDLHRRQGDWRGAGQLYLEAWRAAATGSGARSDLEPQLIAVYRGHGALADLAAQASQGQGAWDQVLAGDVAVAEGRKPRAVEAYRRALALDPSLHAARRRLLQVLPPGAPERIPLLADLAAAQPTDPAGHIELARALFAAKRDADAVQALRDAAARFASAPYVQDELARLLVAQGHPSDALPLYERAVRLDPGNADYQQALGDCQHRLGHQAAAVAAWRPLAGSPPTRAGYQRLLEVLRAHGADDEIGATYRQALERFPGDDELRRDHAEWLRGRGDLEGALAEWKRLAENAGQPSLRDLAGYQVSRIERRLLLNKE
jgi:tetratricopeptide (TPR) repeat protein